MDMRRRRLLFGRVAGRDPLLPPWAHALPAFADACTRCGDCAAACPTRIIDASGAFPVVDFARGECTFCGDCVRICPEPSFDRAAFDAGAAPWTLVAAIGAACLARANVVCRTCGDACAEGAIRFPPAPGRVAVPHLDAAACTGCGACVAVCPAEAITVASASTPVAADAGMQ
jgi:ferredoxin-type protein NapF